MHASDCLRRAPRLQRNTSRRAASTLLSSKTRAVGSIDFGLLSFAIISYAVVYVPSALFISCIVMLNKVIRQIICEWYVH